jgi:hypothetical protein
MAYRPAPRSGLGDINTIAQTIQKVEGYSPGSLSYRLNNPGNLVYAGQSNATPVQVCNPTCHNFASFPTYDAGYSALENQINLDASRGLTIAQFTAKYAPSQDGNDPASYAAQLAAASGLSVSDPLSSALGGSSGSSAAPDASTVALPFVDLSSLDFSGLLTDTVSIAGFDVPVIALAGVVLGLGLWVLSGK